MAAFLHIYLGDRIEDSLAGSVAFAVVLFDVANLGVLTDIEAVNAVMLGIHTAAVADAASRDDDDVAVLAYVEIVIDDVVEAALTKDNRNMNALVLCAGFDVDIDARTVLFGYDLDISGACASRQLTVASYIKCALRNSVEVCHFHEDPLLDLV